MYLSKYFFELQAAKRKPIIVGVIYRPNSHPRADFDYFTRTILYIQDKISGENQIAYLMGDFNINLLSLATHQKTNDFIDNVIAQWFIYNVWPSCFVNKNKDELLRKKVHRPNMGRDNAYRA